MVILGYLVINQTQILYSTKASINNSQRHMTRTDKVLGKTTKFGADLEAILTVRELLCYTFFRGKLSKKYTVRQKTTKNYKKKCRSILKENLKKMKENQKQKSEIQSNQKYQTLAKIQLDAYFEAEYPKLEILGKKLLKSNGLGEDLAGDVVNNTYLEIIARERRGDKTYDESYSLGYDTYVKGVLNTKVKALHRSTNKAKGLRVEPALENDVNHIEYYGDNDGGYDKVLDENTPKVHICRAFEGVCNQTNTDMKAFMKALNPPKGVILDDKQLGKFFSKLRLKCTKDYRFKGIVEDFVAIYSTSREEMESTLEEMGIYR